MGIILPTGVANNLGTPGAITDSIANLPDAADIATGTIFVAPDVPAIYTNDNGTWKSLSGGGGGGGTNPTIYVVPINIGDTFADSNIYNLLNEQIKTFTNSIGNYGLFIDFVNLTTKIGDIEGFNNVSYLNIDNSAEVISTFYTTNFETGENGLKLDFANNEYKIGALAGYHKTYLNIQAINNFIFTVADDVENGLRLDFTNKNFFLGDYANDNYYLGLQSATKKFGVISDGDFSGIELNMTSHIYNFGDPYQNFQTYLQINSSYQTINTFSNGLNNGLIFDFFNNNYKIGDYSTNYTYLEINDNLQTIKTFNNGSNNGLNLDFQNNVFIIGGFINETQINLDDVEQTIFFKAKTSYNFKDIRAYTDNADAISNGLQTGDIYRHSAGGLESADQLRIVH